MTVTVTDKFSRTFNGVNPNVARVVTARTAGAATLDCDNLAGWPTSDDSNVRFSTYRLDTSNSVVSGSQIDWVGIVTGNTIGSMTRVTGATDNGHNIGDVVEMNPTADWADSLVQGILTHANQDGSLKTTAVKAALNIPEAVPSDYTPLAQVPTTITSNGNHSYSLTFPGVNYTDRLSPGMRLRTVRTAAAPNQCASLNGTSQYFSKTSPAGMTFTDDFVVSAWVKMSGYPTVEAGIVSRLSASQGWWFGVNSTGQIVLSGSNAAPVNYSRITSYQSIPLNRWVHITAQLDMSTFTATAATSYILIDGTDVPSYVTKNGTNPTSLVQAGDLQVGAGTAASLAYFPGKIAQVAIFSAKVTQDTIRGYMSQGLLGAETSLISAYSLSNSLNDLNTTNANNLIANGGATATTADSPFGTQADGSISTTVDYAIIQKVSYSSPDTTAIVQVPEGCTIPTSGGVTSISYSQFATPYGFPKQPEKWQIISQVNAQLDSGSLANLAIGPINSWKINVPAAGSYKMILQTTFQQNPSSGTNSGTTLALSTTTTAISDIDLAGSIALANGSTQSALAGDIHREKQKTFTAATDLYVVAKNYAGVSATTYVALSASGSNGQIIAECAYL